MSQRCSICRHPQRDSVDVSVLRDGIRSTARQFQISRSALDRHKRHLSQSIAAHEAREVAVSSDSETPLFPQLEVWIRHCNGALSQAQADKNFRGIIQAIKEQRAYLELKYKLQTEERRQRGLHKDRAQQGSGASDGLQRPPEDIYASIQAITLRLRIRAHRRLLGEQAVFSEPTNLEYLRGQAEVLRARLEQRELLEQSVGLARI
jgi:hypothetical protein